jgi:large subunit ribosomal protein L7/L12
VSIPWRTFEDIERRLTELERMVAHLYRHNGIEPPPEPDPSRPSDEVMSLIAEGKKIEAIARLPEETGVGLADAKRVVEGFEVSS